MLSFIASALLATTPPTIVEAATYNIRHGKGMDDHVNLERTAAAIRSLGAGIVAIQEVDRRAARSGGVDQAAELGLQLGMHHAFGAFMPFDGGEYGLAILSRHPILRSRTHRLPEGNEPRVALFAEVRVPSGETLTVVNVHFDWVADDRFRFAQAKRVAQEVARIDGPFLLMGDFNDLPGSRTMKLFADLAMEARKPRRDRFTFSSIQPDREIDFIVAGPAPRWRSGEASVVADSITSDHRPVRAKWLLVEAH